MINALVLIPSYEPGNTLIDLVKKLELRGFLKILIVNDGSSASCAWVYNTVSLETSAVVVTHEVNKGKGHAIKTGLTWYLSNCHGFDGVVTADSDGQHDVDDIVKIADALSINGRKLILGVRVFDESRVPFKSYFGNKLTKKIFYLVTGKFVSDTQTGLRGIPHAVVNEYTGLHGDRYEYETEMLLKAVRADEFSEVPIKTIYENDNEVSHFNPIVDSFKIYRILLRNGIIRFFQYGFISATSFIIDITLFSLLLKVILPGLTTSLIGTATVVSRVLSATYNFLANRFLVFKSKSTFGHDAVLYVILASVIMGISYGCVKFAYEIMRADPIVAKIVIDLSIFICSFFIQRIFVFKRHKNAANARRSHRGNTGEPMVGE